MIDLAIIDLAIIDETQNTDLRAINRSAYGISGAKLGVSLQRMNFGEWISFIRSMPISSGILSNRQEIQH